MSSSPASRRSGFTGAAPSALDARLAGGFSGDAASLDAQAKAPRFWPAASFALRRLRRIAWYSSASTRVHGPQRSPPRDRASGDQVQGRA